MRWLEKWFTVASPYAHLPRKSCCQKTWRTYALTLFSEKLEQKSHQTPKKLKEREGLARLSGTIILKIRMARQARNKPIEKYSEWIFFDG
jgi:hypothetical protein